MTITSLFPIIRTTDLPRLTDFYEQAFRATVTYRFDQDGTDVYVALSVGGGQIGIGFEPEVERGDAIAVWLYADDVDATYTAALAAGAASVVPPEDMPWGERVAQVRDPDGNLLYLATATPS
jgi:predicted enzyme related to lactoylglutathione lyase